ncbi:hypothetical protein OUZ56_007834 [Daphnia magna]|uniref:Uncharacterized protein n=1 Tax=Daphnia magna TaxID=35525 RepID=A0ABR0ABJ3_9CRUS|nr:hypothetical protein OUZ56_007834 [Daphnia magna]
MIPFDKEHCLILELVVAILHSFENFILRAHPTSGTQISSPLHNRSNKLCLYKPQKEKEACTGHTKNRLLLTWTLRPSTSHASLFNKQNLLEQN